MPFAAMVGLTLVAQAAVPGGAASPAPVASYDVFATILTPEQRAHLTRDNRCDAAKRASDIFVDLRDPRDGVTALVALEKCAALPRVGDWSDFVNYALTAAGAIAYEVGVEASQPKAFERALYDLSHVAGYEAPSSSTVVMITANPTEEHAGPVTMGQIEMEAGLPMQNSKTRTHTTTHVAGYSGAYGELATQVGAAAQAALDASKRGARPQEPGN